MCVLDKAGKDSLCKCEQLPFLHRICQGKDQPESLNAGSEVMEFKLATDILLYLRMRLAILKLAVTATPLI